MICHSNMETNFFIIPALRDENTFFLFRDYAIEIKFTSINGMIKIIGKGIFSEEELIFIKENFL
jgi:hypothetical protein